MNKEIGGIVKAFEATVRKSQAAARKRAKSIFTTMSVAHVDDDSEAPGEAIDTEKLFSSGDVYTGQWANKYPHGQGKYLWADGCMYVGEWFKGQIMGKGKFSWPCGATYEGQFKGGNMDGEGTYTGSSNDSYRGKWVMNMKHGKGTRHYANGDLYEGKWRRGAQEGQGRYNWNNGNQYIGHWKNGKMSGNGTIIWANGNRYDGCWDGGVPKGNGTFRWADGSFYAGVWSRDPKEQSGTFYPSNADMGDFDWDPQQVYTELSECQVFPGEKISVLPSKKMFTWPSGDGEGGHKQSIWKNGKVSDSKPRLKRMSIDWRVHGGNAHSWGSEADAASEIDSRTSGSGREVDEGVENLQIDDSDMLRGTPKNIKIQPTRRQGETICKGHKNYELMLNLQLGIRHSVGRPAPATSLDLKPTAFDTKEKVWTKFPPGGSKYTPPHQSCDFKWKDYCPLVFRTLRKLFKVDPADYMLSICGDDALRELSSPGKSGSFFYLTNDDKYMIKTMKKSEVKVLKRMLPAYYSHVRAFENTLVTNFFGLHCVKLTGAAQKKVRFVIMGNLFCTEVPIHRRFDLKGSSHGRTTDKPEADIDATTTLKDLDLSFIFRLRSIWFQEFCSGTSIRLGINMPARIEQTVRSFETQLVGEPTGECYDVILFFGIIDILQDYDISKKLEHAYKSLQHDPTSISAVDPKQYAKRFRDFIFKVFVDDD